MFINYIQKKIDNLIEGGCLLEETAKELYPYEKGITKSNSEAYPYEVSFKKSNGKTVKVLRKSMQ